VSAPPPPPDIDSVNQEAAAGETVSTSNGAEPTASDPIASWVTTPLAGNVSIEESPSITETPLDSAYTFFGQQVDISVPGSSTSDNPYKLEFALDSSLIPSGENADTIQLFRNGARLPDCTGAEGTAEPDPCVWSRTQLGSNGDVKITAYTSNASSWNFGRLSDQPSVASNDSYATDEDTALNQPAPGVLSNDTDPDGDDLTAALVDNVTHGKLTFKPDGSFSYAPDKDFFGTDTFTYKANDGSADSGVTRVTITVNPINDPPTLEVAAGGACGPSTDRSGTINLAVNDVDNPVASLTLSASSSNTKLVRNEDVVFSGTGATRTMKVTAVDKKSGTANITVTVSDGTPPGTPIIVPVMVGTPQSDVMNGTDAADMIFGLAGVNTLNGDKGNDLLCGGNSRDTLNGGAGDDTLDGANGNDTLRGDADKDILRGNLGDDALTGGTQADSFSGGPGTDSAPDFNAAEGDTKDTTIP
jgi:VCBS repeat-containing protein